MLKLLVIGLGVILGATSALADAADDCDNKSGNVAIAGCTELIKRNPNDTTAYNNRGLAYRKKGELDLAIADLSKAIALNPHYVNAYYNRGLVYEKKGDKERAIADYRKALQVDPPSNQYAKDGLKRLGVTP